MDHGHASLMRTAPRSGQARKRKASLPWKPDVVGGNRDSIGNPPNTLGSSLFRKHGRLCRGVIHGDSHPRSER